MRIQNIFFAVLNPFVRVLLNSRFHGLASKTIAVLSYRGVKTGYEYETPLSYVCYGETILFLSNYNTKWWHNFSDEPYAVKVLIKRQIIMGKARLYSGRSEFLLTGVAYFLSKLPRDAPIYKVKLNSHGNPIKASMDKIEDRVVLVVVERNET